MEFGQRPPDFRLQKTQADDRREKGDLPIEDARARQIAANHAIEGEIDERRERPDVFLFRSELAQPTGDNSGEHIQGQAGPLAVQHGGQRDQRSAESSRQTAADYAQQQRGFEREVTGEEALNADAYPDAECDRNRHPQRQIDLVPGFALFTEDQVLEFLGAHQRARQGCGHAQLDQEVDEY